MPSEQTSFLVEYNGAGGDENDPECAFMVDMDTMSNCRYDLYSCKCFDAFNNTFVCLRTLQGEDIDTVLCQFQACLVFGCSTFLMLIQ